MSLASKDKFKKFNTLLTGVVAGLLLPVLVYFVIYYAAVRGIGPVLFSNRQIAGSIVPIIISHCIIPNLVLFMVFIGINWLQAAKGVLGSAVALTVLLFTLKLTLNIL